MIDHSAGQPKMRLRPLTGSAARPATAALPQTVARRQTVVAPQSTTPARSDVDVINDMINNRPMAA